MPCLKRTLYLLLLCCPACVPVQYASGPKQAVEIETTDRAYHNTVKSVRLYAANGSMPLPELNPAVAPLNNQQLVIEFDLLDTIRETIALKLLHCNYNWRKSSLSDLDFLQEFNAFPVNDFAYSIDTQIPYVHYRVNLPAVKLPGNYVAVVYRNNNPDDVLLTRRFMVYDSRVHFMMHDNPLTSGTTAELNQQLNFTINYARTEIINPAESIHVTVRQNQRWDNLAQGLKPTFIREHQRELDFRFFTSENLYPAGNEFRFFDLRSLLNPGVNVSRVDRSLSPQRVYLVTDKTREGQRYARYPDLNGQYVLANLDNPQPHSAQYVQVHFTLQSPRLQDSVYLSGAFTNWRLDESSIMVYNPAIGAYTADVLLRQGWYNYQYVVKNSQGVVNRFEGNHYEAENLYEIFVYYRPFQPPADLLIGYYRVEVNHPDR
ncbi:MAG: DUF5103 domain-containing protein [Cyclobacteriaceae bacterium]|nr:MAG: DUF5103 domain-containing protein [Cyclobacteriaceae bacterium]